MFENYRKTIADWSTNPVVAAKFQKMFLNTAKGGAGILTYIKGKSLSENLLNKLRFKSVWNKIIEMHSDEIVGWEDEARKIYDTISVMAPSLAADQYASWSLIKNIRNAGGVTYPISRKLLDLESKTPSGSAYQGYRQEKYLENLRETINPRPKRGFSKQSSLADLIPGAKTTLGKVWPFAAAGLAAGVMHPLIGRAISGLGGHINKNYRWIAFKNLHESEIANWENEAREYYFILMNQLPQLLNDDATVMSFLRHMRNQGGVDFSTMTDLLTTSVSSGKKPEFASLSPFVSMLAGASGVM